MDEPTDPARRDAVALPITVIGGYLGAGKTTLLNSLLGQVADRRIGVIVNDFGELGIDADRIASAAAPDSGAVDVVNLPNGCVCCTLGDDLMSTLRGLAELEPPLDEIVVEASGVADPAATAAWGTVPPFSPGGVVVLVAADEVDRRLRDRYVGGEVRRQIVGADLVVLTRTDLAGPDATTRAGDTVRAMTAAPMIEAVSGDVHIDVVLGPATRSGRRRSAPGHPPHGERHADRYVRWSWVDDRPVSLDRLRAALDDLPDGLLRLKGSVSLTDPTADAGVGAVADREAVVNVVGRTVDVAVRPVDGRGPGVRLEAIGVAGVLDVAALDGLVGRFGRDDAGTGV